MKFPLNAFELHVAHQRACRDPVFQAFMAKVLGNPRCTDWKPEPKR